MRTKPYWDLRLRQATTAATPTTYAACKIAINANPKAKLTLPERTAAMRSMAPTKDVAIKAGGLKYKPRPIPVSAAMANAHDTSDSPSNLPQDPMRNHAIGDRECVRSQAQNYLVFGYLAISPAHAGLHGCHLMPLRRGHRRGLRANATRNLQHRAFNCRSRPD